jgi:hypothetical protein
MIFDRNPESHSSFVLEMRWFGPGTYPRSERVALMAFPGVMPLQAEDEITR